MRKIWVSAGLAASLSLAACSGGSDHAAGTANAAAGTSGGGLSDGGGGTSGVKLSPGEWETTSEMVDMKMEGLPEGVPPGMMARMQPPSTTVKSCLTPEEAANPNARMLAAQKDSQCTVERTDIGGGRIDIAMTCPAASDRGKAKIAMTGEYGATSYEMHGDFVIDGPNGMRMTMKSRTTGHRVGDCPA